MYQMAARAEHIHAAALPRVESLATPVGVPWYIWSTVLAVVFSSVGSAWDIAWHKSIGRDSFLTPAHVLVYLSGIVAGLSCGYLILATTFGRDQAARAASVRMWGFRGPIGAFLCSWGALAMIASGPFDNWWHNARVTSGHGYILRESRPVTRIGYPVRTRT
jgi:hypothetical protein